MWVGQPDPRLQTVGCSLNEAFPRLSVLLGKITLCISHSVLAPGVWNIPEDLFAYSVLFITRNWPSVPFNFYFNEVIFQCDVLISELCLQLYSEPVSSLPLFSICTLWKPYGQPKGKDTAWHNVLSCGELHLFQVRPRPYRGDMWDLVNAKGIYGFWLWLLLLISKMPQDIIVMFTNDCSSSLTSSFIFLFPHSKI